MKNNCLQGAESKRKHMKQVVKLNFTENEKF